MPRIKVLIFSYLLPLLDLFLLMTLPFSSSFRFGFQLSSFVSSFQIFICCICFSNGIMFIHIILQLVFSVLQLSRDRSHFLMAGYIMVYLFYIIQSLLLQGSFRLCSVWATTNKAAGNVLKHESIRVIIYLCRMDLHRVKLLGQKYLINFTMLLSQKIIIVLFFSLFVNCYGL